MATLEFGQRCRDWVAGSSNHLFKVMMKLTTMGHGGKKTEMFFSFCEFAQRHGNSTLSGMKLQFSES